MVTLNSRITIQQLASGADEIGQPVESWSDVASVWATVRHVSGLQAIKAGADVSVVHVSVRIRCRTDINAGMRLLHGSDVYDIRAVLPESGRQYVDLVCLKVQ